MDNEHYRFNDSVEEIHELRDGDYFFFGKYHQYELTASMSDADKHSKISNVLYAEESES